jgi:hypothetical protein
MVYPGVKTRAECNLRSYVRGDADSSLVHLEEVVSCIVSAIDRLKEGAC